MAVLETGYCLASGLTACDTVTKGGREGTGGGGREGMAGKKLWHEGREAAAGL